MKKYWVWFELAKDKPEEDEDVLAYSKPKLLEGTHGRGSKKNPPFYNKPFFIVKWYEGRENEGFPFSHWLRFNKPKGE